MFLELYLRQKVWAEPVLESSVQSPGIPGLTGAHTNTLYYRKPPF